MNNPRAQADSRGGAKQRDKRKKNLLVIQSGNGRK